MQCTVLPQEAYSTSYWNPVMYNTLLFLTLLYIKLVFMTMLCESHEQAIVLYFSFKDTDFIVIKCLEQ